MFTRPQLKMLVMLHLLSAGVDFAATCTCVVKPTACPDGCDPDFCRYQYLSCICETGCMFGGCSDGYDEISSEACFPFVFTTETCRLTKESFVRCSKCLPGYYGDNCDPCNCSPDEICADGMDGIGSCILAIRSPAPSLSLSSVTISTSMQLPSLPPSLIPSLAPSPALIVVPTPAPTPVSTPSETMAPTPAPTLVPTTVPTEVPTLIWFPVPTAEPSSYPSTQRVRVTPTPVSASISSPVSSESGPVNEESHISKDLNSSSATAVIVAASVVSFAVIFAFVQGFMKFRQHRAILEAPSVMI